MILRRAIQRAATLLAQAQRPLLLAGGGIIDADASAEAVALAEFLDMALVPLSYAGAEAPEANIGLMPGLVTSYEQGYGWKNAAVGREHQERRLGAGGQRGGCDW